MAVPLVFNNRYGLTLGCQVVTDKQWMTPIDRVPVKYSSIYAAYDIVDMLFCHVVYDSHQLSTQPTIRYLN